MTYFCDGQRIAAHLYLPPVRPGTRVPAVVSLAGFTAVKEVLLPELAPVINSWGVAVLAIDYRGFGESEGERNRIRPWERVADARAALDFLESVPEVDPNRLGLYGVSYGGAVALAAAAVDKRVRWTLALGSPTNGETWLRSLRPRHEWHALLERLHRDSIESARTGRSGPIDAWDVQPPNPEGRAYLESVMNNGALPNLNYRPTLTMASASAIVEFRPIELVSSIAPRCVLFVHSRQDVLVPVEEATLAYGEAGSPKELMLLDGASHYETTRPGPYYERILVAVEKSMRGALLAREE